MRRVGAVILVAATIVGGWSWYRSRPDRAWLCEDARSATCGADLELDVDAALEGGTVSQIDVSGLPHRVVAAIDDGDRQTLALFDGRTGALTRVLLEPTQGWVDQVRFSPDGSVVVATSVGFGDRTGTAQTGTVLGVFDAADGETVAAHRIGDHSISCEGRLGLSPDGSEVQCGWTIRDVSSGEVLHVLDLEENRWAGSGYGDWAWAASGRRFDVDVLRGERQILEVVDGRREVVGVIEVPSHLVPPGRDAAFTDSGDPPRLALIGGRDAGGAWDRWTRTSRSFPLGSLLVVNDQDDQSWVELGFAPDEVGWTSDDASVWLLERDTGRVVLTTPPD